MPTGPSGRRAPRASAARGTGTATRRRCGAARRRGVRSVSRFSSRLQLFPCPKTSQSPVRRHQRVSSSEGSRSGRERFDRGRIARMANLHRCLPAIVIAASTMALVGAAQRSTQTSKYRSWSSYGGGPEQLRYSSLTQINRKNVAKLQVAWTHDTGESGDLQTQPVVVGDIVYAYSPAQRVLALDAATGTVVWTFDAKLQGGRGPNRGVMYWPGDAA